MRSNVENEEGGNILAWLHVVDCGKSGMFFRAVSKLLAVAKLRQRLLMSAAACFRGFDDGGDIVRIAIDRNATEDVFEKDAFSFGVGLVAAKKRGELSARGVAAYKDPVGVAAEIADMPANPAERLCHVSDERFHLHLGQQAVVDGDEHEAF